MNLEKECGSLKKLNEAAKAKKKASAVAMNQREKEILGIRPRKLSLDGNDYEGGIRSSSPSSDDPDKPTILKKTPRGRSSSVDVYDLTDSIREFSGTAEKLISLKEEELKVLSKSKIEENEIKKMEAEARIIEAKNKGEELSLKRAMDEQLKEESIMRRHLDARMVEVLGKLADKL